MDEVEDYRVVNGVPYIVVYPASCPECGSTDIVMSAERREYINIGQTVGFPWCRGCGLIFDFMLGFSSNGKTYIDDGR